MIREFGSLKDLFGYIDSQIAQYRKVFGDLIRVVEDLRARAERQKKILEVISKLTPGTQAPGEEASSQIDLKGVKVVVNPSPLQELSSFERLLEEINVRITRLTNIRKDLEVLATVDLSGKITVFFKDDVPETIIIKI
ncbi:MAG TPA: hypothetical protein VNL13_09840 [Sulfolobales archaeon]|nr:hypothetical protein [Sulfolobales archaeon]